MAGGQRISFPLVWVDTRTAAPATPALLFYHSDIEDFIVLQAVHPYAMTTQTDELQELKGVEETYEYEGALEVRFHQDAIEETIACILSWAKSNDHTVVTYESLEDSEVEDLYMLLVPDPDGELASWKDKLE